MKKKVISLINYYLQQWGTFARIWHLYDAKWQDPYVSALYLKKYLMGLYKPIYHAMSKYQTLNYI